MMSGHKRGSKPLCGRLCCVMRSPYQHNAVEVASGLSPSLFLACLLLDRRSARNRAGQANHVGPSRGLPTTYHSSIIRDGSYHSIVRSRFQSANPPACRGALHVPCSKGKMDPNVCVCRTSRGYFCVGTLCIGYLLLLGNGCHRVTSECHHPVFPFRQSALEGLVRIEMTHTTDRHNLQEEGAEQFWAIC